MVTCPRCQTQYPDGTEVCTLDGARLPSDRPLNGLEDQDLPQGSLVGEYRLEQKLGAGGFGTVHRATHTVIGKVAAVKILHSAYSGNAQIVSRFVAEARAVNQIRHKNIIDIFAFGRLEDGRHYFVMELLEGETLEQLLRRVGRLHVEQALEILRPVARALDAAHAAGIAHRDLKPDNVFLVYGDDGKVVPKLLDFGIAKLLDSAGSAHKTETGTPIGTPHYMSPEQCRGLALDERTDVYSFGVLTYRVLSGRLPFDAPTALDVMFKQIHETARPLSQVTGDLPPAFDAPLAAMMAKEPSARPKSVEGALDQLAQTAVSAGFNVPAPGPSQAPRRPDTEGVRVLTASQPKLGTPTYAQARTLEAPSTPPTLGASEHDVRSPAGTRSRSFALGLVLVAAIAGGALLLRKPAAPATVAAPVESSPPAASSVPAVVSAEPADPRTVVLSLQGARAGSEVFLGHKRLGAADGPLELPFGREPIVLTLRAAKFKPASVEVTPDRDQSLKAPELLPAKTAAPRPPKPRKKEYEDPF